MKNILSAFLITNLFRLLRWTWRIEEEEWPQEALSYREKGKTLSFAHWHGDEWALLGAFAGRPMAVLVSESSDGSLMTRILKSLGFTVSRGSSSRNAVKGLLSLIRSLKKQSVELVSLAVDGPRGPIHEPKAGIVAIGQMLGSGLIMVSAVCDRKWIFEKSWNKAILPKPFAKIVIKYEYLDAESLKQEDKNRLISQVKKAFQSGHSRAQESLLRRDS